MHNTAPTAGEIVTLAEQALAPIFGRLARHLSGADIAVEDTADDGTQDEIAGNTPGSISACANPRFGCVLWQSRVEPGGN